MLIIALENLFLSVRFYALSDEMERELPIDDLDA
jgi:hypothetical protein